MSDPTILAAAQGAFDHSVRVARAVLEFIQATKPTEDDINNDKYVGQVADVIRNQSPTPIGLGGVARQIDTETREDTIVKGAR